MKFNPKSLALCILMLTASLIGRAQLIVTIPSFPSDNDSVEVIFDATLGSGGLAGYTGDVYAYTGVITNLSTAPSDWKYVKTDWGQNTPETLLQRIGENLYKLTIGPSVRQYYNVPAGETILQMAFVFRSSTMVNNKWLEGKTETGGDIFADVYPDGLFVRFNSPENNELLVLPGDEIPVEIISNKADSLFLFVDDVLIRSEEGNTLTAVIQAEGAGKKQVTALARKQEETATETFNYFVRQQVSVQELPEGITDGINYLDDNTVTLSLYAPGKEFAFVIGDFNDWEFTDEGYMYKTPDGKHFWATISNLEPGREYIYQYLVDGNIRIGDPYAEKVSDPWNDKYISPSTYPVLPEYPATKTTGIATVLQTAQQPYVWETDNFQAPDKSKLVIYELLIRDFVANHDYKTLTDTLNYLKELGINAIELMPFSEFEGNSSWGYNPNYYFAPDKYYGPAEDLKRFIDVCHKNGIAVIMDMVLNHSFGTSPMVKLYWDAANNRPSPDNPWFNPIPKHDYNVGFDFNHESPDTKALVSRVVKYWIENFRVDGYRFDLSKGFTQKNTLGNTAAWGQYDASRIAIWKAISDTIWSVNPDAYVILEHFAENSEEKELANYGMMLWGNMTNEYAAAARGVSSGHNLSQASYKTRGWNEPNLVAYMESHDEERLLYRVLKEGNTTNPAYPVRDTTIAMQRAQLASVFHYMIPGPKMLWQFGELGYDYSINYNGRLGEKPIRWNYLNDYRRKTLKNVTASLIKLRQSHEVFSTADFTLSVTGLQKKISLYNSDMNVVVIGNFDVNTGFVEPGFSKTGFWYEYFTGDSINVTSLTDKIELKAGEYRLYTDKRLVKPETGLGIGDHTGVSGFIEYPPYPNPASGNQIVIPVSFSRNTNLEIGALDITGREVASIYSGGITAGKHNFTWSPQSGEIKPGLYLIYIRSDFSNKTHRILVN